jgi:UDP-glucose 4-epimerase
MTRILISGGAGFIGSHAADALHKAKHDVLVIDNFSTGRMENLTMYLADGGNYTDTDVRLCDGDVWSFPTMLEVFQNFKPEVVVHLAAQAAISTSKENPIRDMEINGIGTLNIIHASLKFGVKRIIFSSTSAVYREQKHLKTKEESTLEPNTPYGISKLAAEGYVRSIFGNSVILRFGNVYGPRQVPIGENQLISRMIRHFKYGDMFFIHGSGNQTRDYIYVSDVVKAIMCAIKGPAGTFNVASGQSISVNEIGAILERRYGVVGYPWAHTNVEDPRKRICMDIGHAEHKLHWSPEVKIIDGINRTADWWESCGKA